MLKQVGDKIPADLRLIEIYGSCLKIDQAILTGESNSVTKIADTIFTDLKCVKQEQMNMAFSVIFHYFYLFILFLNERLREQLLHSGKVEDLLC